MKFKAIILIYFSISFSAYLQNIAVNLKQPDNTYINAYASGDEFYIRLHDSLGYTIIQHPVDGFYYYASLVNEKIAPSLYTVNSIFPDDSLINKNIMITENEYKQRRYMFMQNYPVRDAPSYGIINNINIFIRFSDEPEFSTARSVYDQPFNNPSGSSLLNYYLELSYENLEVNTTHYPLSNMNTNLSYQDENPRSYYQIYHSITNPDGYFECPPWDNTVENNCSEIDSTLWSSYREQTLLKNAIEFIENEIPEQLDVDANDDGYVDNVTFLVYGSPDGWAELLWPHRSSLRLFDAYINNALVDGYNINLSSGGYFNASVLCHEFGHSLGAPDLYRYFNNNMTPMGSWDLMASNTTTPQYMSAWMQYRYTNWIDCPFIETGGVYELYPLASGINNCYQIKSPHSNTEHFILEYRTNQGTYDSNIPGNSDGILIYRVNLDINSNGIIDTLDYYGEDDILDGWIVGGNGMGPPDELYVYRPLGTLSNTGVLNNAIYSAEVGRTEISGETEPSSFLSTGEPGGLHISNIGYPGETIQFTYHVICNETVYGDINEDFVINILDVVQLVNFVLSGNNDSCFDINDDSIVNILDIIITINIILGS